MINKSQACSLLIVDDCIDDSFKYRRMLKKHENNVEIVAVVEDGQSALNYLSDHNVDCILLDYLLPDIDGLSILKKIRSSNKYQSVAIIILTGEGNESIAIEVMHNGGQDYLIKGCFNDDQLQHSILNAVKSTRLQNELDFMAHHDGLTGLVSRSLFLDRLKQFIKRANRNEISAALLYLDLDHFKKINDNYGHDIGDKVIKETSLRIQSTIRESDTACRLGGDEFAILLEGVEQKNANLIANKLTEAFKLPFSIKDNDIYLSCSIGLALFPDTADSAEELMNQADKALYDAKDNGRATTSNFTLEQLTQWRQTMVLERDIHFAQENNELWFAYQPIVSMHNAKVVSLEALARWQHPELGNIPPDVFIPIMHHAGLILGFTEWLFEQTLTQLVDWLKIYPTLKLSLNIPSSFCQSQVLANALLLKLKEMEIFTQQVELEITETSLMEKPGLCFLGLSELKKNGLRIAVDDFGTGYSSMSYLADLPLNVLKIDKHFLTNVPNDTKNNNIIKAIIALSKSLGLATVAEGIETQEQWDFLHQSGCDYAQGYLIAKPMPARAVLDFLDPHK